MASPGGLAPAPRRTPDELARRIAALRPARDRAPVELLVQRLPGEGRATPTSVVLDPVEGVVGDRWSRARAPRLDAQVTLMRWDVARLLGEDPAVFGDNLLAPLDTSADNLPPGTIVRVGVARCVVTPAPHTGCSKFAARAGPEALAFSRDPAWSRLQLRGVHLRVLDRGEVRVGDEILVESRPGSA